MTINVTALDGGYCLHLERMVIKDGRLKTVKFPSLFFYIYHPQQGHILFDTGYSERFHDATKNFPEKIYALLTPVEVKEEDLAINKLGGLGIKPEEINYIFISHFHADHIAALKDFDKAKFIVSKQAWLDIKDRSRFGSLVRGVLPSLIPENFEDRLLFYEEMGKEVEEADNILKGFKAWDLFKDGSMLAVPIPGHTCGHSGLLVDTGIKKHFLVGDACWMSRSIRDFKLPALPAYLIMDSKQSYYESLSKLNALYKGIEDIEMLPSHCGEVFAKKVKNKSVDQNNMNSL
ncbi:MAG: MBL fold metallo-hydrolase [Oligoflexales bacterium]|nr:MBL fold metallo-hydrolase [Oligoflexales bacterium]